MVRRVNWSWIPLIMAMLFFSVLQAQNSVPQQVKKLGYADEIVVNGKIVSMDDQGNNANSGHGYEAMAVKGTRIMALGSNQEIRAMADEDTKVMDVGGHLVIPGIIDSHSHLFSNPTIARSMGLKYPNKGTAINVTAGKDMESTRMIVENAISEEVKKLQPGDWVYLGINPNPKEDVSTNRIFSWTTRGELENITRLTRVAPQNPVEVKVITRATVNKAALDILNKLFPDFEDYEQGELADLKEPTKQGMIGEGAAEALEWYEWYGQQPLPVLAEMVRINWQMAAAHGETAFGSRTYNPRIVDTATYLNRMGLAPIRYMLMLETHRMPGNTDFAQKMYKMTGNLTGLGNDMMWIGGVSSELWDSSFPLDCLGKDVPAPPNIKIRELCRTPGNLYWETLKNALGAGWRIASVHGVGSDGVRRFIQMIESAMKDYGLTVEDIRKLHISIDHAEALGNVPDVMNKVKELGIIVSPNPIRMLKEPDYVRDYGPQVEPFIEPIKSWLDEGVKVVGQFEGYRGIGQQLYLVTTRDIGGGHIVLPDQKLDRVTALKMWTTWAPQYMMKEDIGTLEVGKLADFTVLDKDYFTIPVEEFVTIRPQMTVVGGKVQYLLADFGKTMKMEPVGYQLPPGYQPWGRGGGGGQ